MIEVNTKLIRALTQQSRLGTKKAVAELLGVGESTYNHWCQGRNFRMKYIELMCRTFHYSVGSFMKIVGETADHVGKVEDWQPISYNFPLLYADLTRKMTIEEVSEKSGISTRRLMAFKSKNSHPENYLMWQEFIALMNIAHLYPEPYITDENGVFPMDEETKRLMPNHKYVEYRLKEADELKAVKEDLEKLLNEKDKEIEDLKTTVEQTSKNYDAMRKANDMIGTKSSSTKAEKVRISQDKEIVDKKYVDLLTLASDVKLRINELIEDPAKSKGTCLGELQTMLHNIPLPEEAKK